MKKHFFKLMYLLTIFTICYTANVNAEEVYYTNNNGISHELSTYKAQGILMNISHPSS